MLLVSLCDFQLPPTLSRTILNLLSVAWAGWCHHPDHAGICCHRLCQTLKGKAKKLGGLMSPKTSTSVSGLPLVSLQARAACAVETYPRQPAGLPIPAPQIVPVRVCAGCSTYIPLCRQQFMCCFAIRLLVFIKPLVMKLPSVTSLQLLCWLKSGFKFATAPALPVKV